VSNTRRLFATPFKTEFPERYSLAQQYVYKLIKPGYMFQLYSDHQAYLQSLVELYMLTLYRQTTYKDVAQRVH
jgi:hypothetical protein